MLWTSRFGRKKAKIAFTGLRPVEAKTKDLLFLKSLLEKGAFTPVIDRSWPLAQLADAHRYVDRGHKRGSVVIEIAKGDRS
ncbi:zinc-binding dehydrogenase [bacterium]|nr:zinc-binding dehydrogenase [bacterium]